eukprot:366528-Chlamydomonas_euryale.AAC.5
MPFRHPASAGRAEGYSSLWACELGIATGSGVQAASGHCSHIDVDRRAPSPSPDPDGSSPSGSGLALSYRGWICGALIGAWRPRSDLMEEYTQMVSTGVLTEAEFWTAKAAMLAQHMQGGSAPGSGGGGGGSGGGGPTGAAGGGARGPTGTAGISNRMLDMQAEMDARMAAVGKSKLNFSLTPEMIAQGHKCGYEGSGNMSSDEPVVSARVDRYRVVLRARVA